MDLQKNLDRLEGLLFGTCGCSKEEARIVVETFLRELYLSKEERDAIKHRRNSNYEKWLKEEYEKKQT